MAKANLHNKGKEFRATFNKQDKVNDFTSCCNCAEARISKLRRASGKARSLVKLLHGPRLRDNTPNAPLVSTSTKALST